MMKQAVYVLLSLLIASNAIATQLVEVHLPDQHARMSLFSSHFDVIHIEGESAEVVAWPGDLEHLTSLGLTYTVIHENLEAFYRSRLNPELDDMGGYPTWSEIRDWYNEMVSLYPTLVSTVDTIGFSLENRPLWAFKITDNPAQDEDEPEVFLNAAIHAREVITPLVLMNFAEYLCENYDTDPTIADLVDSRETWILPVVNPDGYVYNEELNPDGGGMWRKNKREYLDVLYGVDLNRNWSFQWGFDDYGSSASPDAPTYRGTEPGSEPEIAAMMDFINSREFKLIINYHSCGNLIGYPYGYSLDVAPNDIAVYEILADSLNLSLNWLAGRPEEILYRINGDACDWQEGGCEYNTFGFLFEVGTYGQGFWPPVDDIAPLCSTQVNPLLTVLRLAGEVEALTPPATPRIAVADTVSSDYTVYWRNADTLEVNAPYTFDVLELKDLSLTDPVDPDSANGRWELDGFSLVNDSVYSEPVAFYSGSGVRLSNTLTTSDWYEVQDTDTLSFMCTYEMEAGWEYAYVQATPNNRDWINLEGNITTNDNPHGRNSGNGITGSSLGWIRAEFPLDELAGNPVRFRFTYRTSAIPGQYGIVIDDIYPVMNFSTVDTLAAESPDTSITLELPDSLHAEEQRWYKVRCIDTQRQVSGWSYLAKATLIPDTTNGDVANPEPVPVMFKVSQVFPNPFNPVSSLMVDLPSSAKVRMTVFDILGRMVHDSKPRKLNAGTHKLYMDGTHLASGVYLIRLDVSGSDLNEVIWRKAVLMK